MSCRQALNRFVANDLSIDEMIDFLDGGKEAYNEIQGYHWYAVGGCLWIDELRNLYKQLNDTDLYDLVGGPRQTE